MSKTKTVQVDWNSLWEMQSEKDKPSKEDGWLNTNEACSAIGLGCRQALDRRVSSGMLEKRIFRTTDAAGRLVRQSYYRPVHK